MKIADALRLAGEAVLDALYPPHCAKCLAETPSGVHLCPACAGQAPKIEAPFCRQCSQPFDGAIEGEFVCGQCKDRKLPFDCAVARYRSRGVVREFIHRFKYERHFYLRQPLGEWLAETLEDERIAAQPFDALVPVPLHTARYRERDFNQAEVLAKLLAKRAGKPVLKALKRIRYTTTQTRLDRDERMENLRNAFRVRHASAVHSRHLILVDDVFTTGSTVAECARVLRQAGAASVRVVTVARG
ncbi:MAG: ComF family protein [Chthoniobacter sp.]|nr:ComF family protein [Chthoniobacter sp.]